MSRSPKSLKEDLEEFLNKVVEFVNMAESAPDECLDKNTCMHVYTTLYGYCELIESKAVSLFEMTNDKERKKIYKKLSDWAFDLQNTFPLPDLFEDCMSAQSHRSTQQVTSVWEDDYCYPKWRDILPLLKNLQGDLEGKLQYLDLVKLE